MKNRKIFFTVALMAAMLLPMGAWARIYVPIDQPSDQKFPIAVADLRGSGGRDMAGIIRNDMELSGYFRVLSEDSFKDVARKEGISIDTIRFDFWTAIEAGALVKGEVSSEGGKMTVTLRLFDPFLKQMLVGKQYRADKKSMREIAHRFSNEIMLALTGIWGVFDTRISYTAVSGKKSKEIYVMDMDGHGPFAVTKNKSINMGSAWSPDGGRLAFTSYLKNNPDVYVSSLNGGNLHRISIGGSNITPAWSPDGGIIAFSSSAAGTANLYTISPGGGAARRLTAGSSIDISPDYSPDGGSIVFASERAGGLHIFRTSASGGGVQRLTFVGYQNDMPSWSPIGDKIAFAGRDMGTFDIFIMNADGSNIQRLTIGTGSNEHPSFSPDGRMITFSSSREGGAAIYIMRADGSNQTRVSKGNGMLPVWGPQKRPE
ncbi:MAG: Tol-Pal system beta propeller repeat protein TolB [Proteobacteria bacterium]|nr:Tol-Pal system beta propeller repeat protein TolB [Pseudomonadota bacterium]